MHIGTFKTGSTALQFYLHKNRERLLRNGIYYGDYFENSNNHSNLCYGLLKEALIYYGIFDKYKEHPRFINVAEKPEDVIDRIKKNSIGKTAVIISCEAFFSDAFRTLVGLYTILSEEEKNNVNQYIRKRLKTLLFEISDDITIICYLRRQDLFIESQYNQYCKNIWYSDLNDEIPAFEKFVSCRPIQLNYYDELLKWNEIFDGAKFMIRPYEKESLKPDLITDFCCEILKIENRELHDFEDINRLQGNLRLDRDILEYKKRLHFNNNNINQLLKKYSGQLDQIKDYAYFSKTQRIEFLNLFSKQNENVAKEYLNNSSGQLFNDLNIDIPVYTGLGMESVFKITRFLLKESL